MLEHCEGGPWDAVGNAGVIEARTARVGEVTLSSGRTLPDVEVAYEIVGQMSPGRDNVILACHALSGDAHVAGWRTEQAQAAGWRRSDGPRWSPPSAWVGDPDASPASAPKPGWWDPLVGPGKAFDTDRYCVICANVLGGCSGTTGPSSPDPATGRPWGLGFPVITVEDMVEVQARLLDSLGVERLLSVAGGSMGGMQALAWARWRSGRVASCIPIATTARLGAQAIAFNEVGRTAILGDPAFRGGAYYDRERPEHGLAVARMVGHITYLSDASMRDKFGRRLRDRDEHAFGFETEFEVESYLAHQGRRFTERFDANTYLYMTKAMDYFDLAAGVGSLAEALRQACRRWLILSFSSDWLFPTYHSRELVDALASSGAEVSFAEIESPYGHDAFLLEPQAQTALIAPFLAGVQAAETAERGGRR